MKNYAREVQFARSKRGENYALAVAIDGDRDKLENRLRQLDQQLVEAGLPKRKTDEMIAVFVPTRNIETWELWLCGDREVDEEGDFKRPFEKARHTGDASTKAAVAAWFRSLSPEDSELERQVLPSLADGRVETARLDRRRS
ncbi:MAG: hypothetical protein GY719_00670 [bacterium]|nr:hypothetical protein [bacterium]